MHKFIIKPRFEVLITVFVAFFSKISLGEESECSLVSETKFCVTPQFNGGRLDNQLFEVATALSIARDALLYFQCLPKKTNGLK
mgnify:CR=1 FL=1